MEIPDARSLSPEAQEALRERVVHAIVTEGRSITEAARTCGVHRGTASRGVNAYRRHGDGTQAARTRGRRYDHVSIELTPHVCIDGHLEAHMLEVLPQRVVTIRAGKEAQTFFATIDVPICARREIMLVPTPIVAFRLAT